MAEMYTEQSEQKYIVELITVDFYFYFYLHL